MRNTAKIDEIQREIRSIENGQEEAEKYMRKLQKEEEESYGYLRKTLWNIGNEFEACEGDRHLTRLLEEKYSKLQEVERECGQLLATLEEEQSKLKYQCESDIEELRREVQQLQMEVV